MAHKLQNTHRWSLSSRQEVADPLDYVSEAHVQLLGEHVHVTHHEVAGVRGLASVVQRLFLGGTQAHGRADPLRSDLGQQQFDHGGRVLLHKIVALRGNGLRQDAANFLEGRGDGLLGPVVANELVDLRDHEFAEDTGRAGAGLVHGNHFSWLQLHHADTRALTAKTQLGADGLGIHFVDNQLHDQRKVLSDALLALKEEEIE